MLGWVKCGVTRMDVSLPGLKRQWHHVVDQNITSLKPYVRCVISQELFIPGDNNQQCVICGFSLVLFLQADKL